MMFVEPVLLRGSRSMRRVVFLLLTLPFGMLAANAQDADESDDADEAVEEIVTVGSQIKGAQISEALAVSVMTSVDIEALGIDSGDELLEYMAEQGQNYFAESENISGGVNSARGDIGAYNLRNLGTGNTLVLLNGRRMVNAASYQTEEVGGSFVPVNTVNSQALPVSGLERVEVLRDGASAIYGADAVAGVVNYVMKSDFEGLTVSAKYAEFQGLPRNDQNFDVEWGKNFNGGRTNVSVFANYYNRDPVNSQDDPHWKTDDYSDRVPFGSPWEGNSAWNGSSVNSEYGQFDIGSDGGSEGGSATGLSALGITDTAGEFHTYPNGHPECDWDLNETNCGANDSGALIYRYNNNENRDLYSELERMNLFTFINHEFENGLESFTELSVSASDTSTLRQGSTRLTAVAKTVIPAQNYYNPFGPCGSVNRLPDSIIGTNVPCSGLSLTIDNHRWITTPRLVDNKGIDYRILQGFRGSVGDWDWETAASWARATKEDITYGRISNILLEQGLADSTPAAINLFSGRDNTNIERASITVFRDNETELTTLDFRISNNNLFEMPAGPVGFVGGMEYREESFLDDRDPRLDGQIEYIDNEGNGFPLVSDVMNSSPSLDSEGDRDVISAFAELQLPLTQKLDMQAAMRYEDFSDVGDTTVGKVALGWRVIEPILIRGSWSEAFRVPNLVTVNESGVARSNTTNDYVYLYVDPTEAVLDGRYGVQRTAGGSDLLVPEQSTNTSIGVVIDATPNLTFTLDFWSIEKDDTIGLFGEDNHTALDLLLLLEAGNSSCSGDVGNPTVVREANTGLSPEALALFDAAGICPVGSAQRVEDIYQNLDTRKVSGQDVGIYFNKDTSAGEFSFTYNGSFLSEYKQVPGPRATALLDAKESGLLPPSVVVEGFGSLVRKDGNPREKHSMRLTWRKGDWGAALSGVKIGDVYQEALTLPDGSRWILTDMTTFNTSVDYRFDTYGDTKARLRFGIVNLTNKRAPLADDSFGYNGDVHRDLPRSYYVDLRLAF
jgi:outer membrane receptor protein involved in Fe transport